ncbi:UNVERIFIED_CONTAM: putative mitochondrial protein, partial [Sesamum latifolium]
VFPYHNQKHETWELLRQLHRRSSLPWLCCGDLNAILFNHEKESSSLYNNNHIRGFREVIEEVELHDLGYIGPKFTWSNNRKALATVRVRLDRAFACHRWKSRFLATKVSHLPRIYSDHRPIMIEIEIRINRRNRSNRIRRFEAYWVKAKECEQIITKSWKNQESSLNHEEAWSCIDNCKVGLFQWSDNVTGESRIQKYKLKAKLVSLLGDKEIKWKQRSKVEWLREGDKNTTYFHAKASSCWNKNQVRRLKDDYGDWKEEEDEVREIILNYFRNIFSSVEPPDSDMDDVLNLVHSRVLEEVNQHLIRPYTSDEVTLALSQMSPLKSPGPDGLPPLFFQKYWNIVGIDVIKCVLEFLNSHTFLPRLNHTYIVLIPKCATPESVSQFRPISLCNVIYKLASKAISNRLKACLDSIISPSQSAFIQGRLITDNVLISCEIHHFLKNTRKGKVGNAALKLDMSKAYDRIEWRFLERVLGKLGFHQSFISLIMLCVASVSFSFILNSRAFGHIQPHRGLRQEDPLSPYLFICCVEALGCLIQNAEDKNRFKGIAVARNAPRISHLLLDDDSLIFGEATKESFQCIRDILRKYEKASGQFINLQKSSVVFSRNTEVHIQEELAQIIGVTVADRYEKYLGLPSCIWRSKREIFQYIRKRIWKRVLGWKEKFLSQAGKEVLIKSVLQAVPSYAMSCFIFPKTLIKEIESILADFWWSSPKEKGIHWVAWNKLCDNKDRGSMGFHDLEAFNIALVAKQAWRILTKPESLLSKVLKARYFPRVHFLDFILGSNPSSTWRSIWSAKPLLQAGCRWRIGNGKQVRIWRDPWVPRPHFFGPINRTNGHPPNTTVSELIDPDNHCWKEELIDSCFDSADAELMKSLPLARHGIEDTVVWHYSKNGIYSVKSAYYVQRRLN